MELCAVIEPFYPKARAEGALPGGIEANAAYSLFAAVVRVERYGGGRGLVRIGINAPICGYRSGQRAGAGRDDGMQVSPTLNLGQ